MAYDGSDGYVVLFGGGTTLASAQDTWSYVGGNWTKLTPIVHPQARGANAIVYDAADGYILLFGGGSPSGVYLNDTWTFHAGSWTRLHLAVHPSGRINPGIAYDAKDHYVVLFGGYNQTAGHLNDTWTFVAGHWKQASPSVSPPARRSMGMTYDAGDRYVLLFGGYSPTYGDLADTWSYSAGVWTQLAVPSGSPGVRVAPAMVDDAVNHYVLLTAGRDDNTLTVYNDTWTFKGGNWTQLFPKHSLTARQWPSAAYDGRDQQVVVFGGSSTAYLPLVYLGDTWVYRSGFWHH